MSEQGLSTQEPPAGEGLLQVLWQRKVWWLLPAIVLVLFLAIIYALGHLSAADPETYPTTQESQSTIVRAC